MFPAQRGLYAHRSTMNQFAKPGYPFMAFDPFPFTNANLTDLSGPNKSPLMQYSSGTDEYYDHEVSKDAQASPLPPKKPLTKAERRAEHNAIERARRENLNTKFQSLAQALPNLINYRRPSKSQIVEKALDWVKQSIAREERYRYQILQLQRENKRLLAQLMHQQQENGSARQPMPANPMPTICSPPVSIMNTSSAPISMYNHYTTTTTAATSTITSPIPVTNATTPIMGANANNNGWSNHPYLMNSTPQMTHYNTSTEDLSKQDFASTKSDDDDNASSGNEDDIDYPSCNASYLENKSPQKQYEKVNQKNLLAEELYPVGGFQSTDTPFESSMLVNNWNHPGKFSPHMINGGNIDPGLSSRSAPAQMLS
ncbi:MAG: hypothetical protein EXX96DRAFT_646199 [Benjaminiella poitrasii]|nr:MAG: hypothetical protein EXX96DRAFT_646199 [Benjaminiella poitrasii]